MGGFVILERLLSSVRMEYLKQLMGIASEDEIFMESQLLNYKLAIKVLAIFTEHDNY